MLDRRHIKAPKTYDPGKGRAKEHLAYLNKQEMTALMLMNGGNQERGPAGLPSFPIGTTGGANTKPSTTTNYNSGGTTRSTSGVSRSNPSGTGSGGSNAGSSSKSGQTSSGRAPGASAAAAKASAAKSSAAKSSAPAAKSTPSSKPTTSRPAPAPASKPTTQSRSPVSSSRGITTSRPAPAPARTSAPPGIGSRTGSNSGSSTKTSTTSKAPAASAMAAPAKTSGLNKTISGLNAEQNAARVKAVTRGPGTFTGALNPNDKHVNTTAKAQQRAATSIANSMNENPRFSETRATLGPRGFTKNNIGLKSKTVAGEAGNEDVNHQTAAANTMLNRVSIGEGMKAFDANGLDRARTGPANRPFRDTQWGTPAMSEGMSAIAGGLSPVSNFSQTAPKNVREARNYLTRAAERADEKRVARTGRVTPSTWSQSPTFKDTRTEYGTHVFGNADPGYQSRISERISRTGQQPTYDHTPTRAAEQVNTAAKTSLETQRVNREAKTGLENAGTRVAGAFTPVPQPTGMINDLNLRGPVRPTARPEGFKNVAGMSFNPSLPAPMNTSLARNAFDTQRAPDRYSTAYGEDQRTRQVAAGIAPPAYSTPSSRYSGYGATNVQRGVAGLEQSPYDNQRPSQYAGYSYSPERVLGVETYTDTTSQPDLPAARASGLVQSSVPAQARTLKSRVGDDGTLETYYDGETPAPAAPGMMGRVASVVDDVVKGRYQVPSIPRVISPDQAAQLKRYVDNKDGIISGPIAQRMFEREAGPIAQRAVQAGLNKVAGWQGDLRTAMSAPPPADPGSTPPPNSGVQYATTGMGKQYYDRVGPEGEIPGPVQRPQQQYDEGETQEASVTPQNPSAPGVTYPSPSVPVAPRAPGQIAGSPYNRFPDSNGRNPLSPPPGYPPLSGKIVPGTDEMPPLPIEAYQDPNLMAYYMNVLSSEDVMRQLLGEEWT